jgi:hypothetical protein
MKDPINAWHNLIDDFASYEIIYGQEVSNLLGIALRIGQTNLTEWTFPYISNGALLLGRFENYKEMLIGPHIIIGYRADLSDYSIEYYLNESIKGKEEYLRGIEDIDINEIGRWLDLPLIDGINE